ncbi:nSTAND1 domain-containing NTPase, partial [Catellatospora bangladeshensis]|uniref:nSTAND1 domain-containing NTPase n=1 Tax=Catellatospora bangladeshensis TaxID=310355 RepID=UPI0019447131
MAVRRREKQRFDYKTTVYAVAVGVVTNLATGQAAGWPHWLQPVVAYAWLLGVLLLAGLGVAWARERWGRVRAVPRWDGVGGDDNPYPGLSAYRQERAGVFAGRDQERSALVERVATTSELRLRFVPVVGPSGAGKSSLVLGGLLPQLDRNRWKVLTDVSPGSDGLSALAAALDVGLGAAASRVSEQPKVGADDLALGPVLARLARLRGSADALLVVVDQLEELATLHTEQERVRFMALLACLVRLDRRLVVVATVRSEYLGVFQQGPGAELFTFPFMVHVMGRDQLRQVIEKPAEQTDTTLAARLVDDILADADATGGGDVLPLLSCYLSDLYARRGGDHHITREHYRTAGTVFDVINRRAALAVADTSLPLRQCLDVLMAFVSLTEVGAKPTRQLVAAADLDSRARTVVEAFVTQRLITSDVRAGTPVYEIAHEALLRRWDAMRAHIDAHAVMLSRATELGALAAAWRNAGHSPDYLVDGRRLRELDAALGRLVLPEDSRRYLTAAVERDCELREARADAAARTALATLATDPHLALAMAYAICSELAATSAARYALKITVPAEEVLAWQKVGYVHAMAFDPEGLLAIGFDDNTVRVCNRQGQLLHVLTGHTDDVLAVAFDTDGRLATGSLDRTVRVWDRQGRLLRTLTGHTGGVLAVAFDTDGRLATGSSDHTTRIWDRHGQLLHTLKGHTGVVAAVAFATDGRLATSSHDRTTRIWDRQGRLLHILKGHTDNVKSVAFDTDGRLATGSIDDTVRVWDRQGQLLHTLTGHTHSVLAVAFDTEGRLATGSSDRTVRIWDQQGHLLHSLTGHTDNVTAVAFDTEGRLATGSADKSVRFWGQGGEALAVLRGSPLATLAAALYEASTITGVVSPQLLSFHLPATAVAVAFDADGRLATGSSDRTVRIWDRQGQL